MADLKVKVYSQDGSEVGSVTLSKEVFGVEAHNQVMFDAVLTSQANARQATAKTKKRFEDKKEQVEQELVLQDHQFGLVVEQYSAQLENKTSRLNKTRKLTH